jgi:hypothetical protein
MHLNPTPTPCIEKLQNHIGAHALVASFPMIAKAHSQFAYKHKFKKNPKFSVMTILKF